MTRKLRRRKKNADVAEETSKVKKPRIRKKKVIKKYVAQQCAYVNADGVRCKNRAVGKSTLCGDHGGDPIIKENLLSREEEKALYDPLNTKYKPDYHPIAYVDFSREGLSKVEIAARFEVSTETINTWAEKYDSFYTATEIGDALHEAWWLTQGKAGLNTRGFNTGLFKFLTSNKIGYSDKMETKSMNMNIHGVLKVPDAVTEEEWEDAEYEEC